MVEVSGVGRGSDRLQVRAKDWLKGKTSFTAWREKAQQKGAHTIRILQTLP